MKPDRFATPVTILTGLGIPTPISTVMQAYRTLLEWPGLREDPAHRMALKACRAGIDGTIDVETVRAVFAAFAEKHDLLAPDLTFAAVGRSRPGGNPHLA